MSTAHPDKYNPTIDLLRILSIVSVVLIHTSTKILDYFKYDLVNQTFVLFLNQASRFAVPLFFLISAFVLELNYPEKFNYFSYLKKRLSRLFLPFLFWSALYYFVIYPLHSKNFMTALVLGDSSYQLYFIPTLFIFYLVFPFFHRHFNFFIKKTSLLILALLQITFLSIDYYYHTLPFPYPISVFLLNFNLFILGIIVSHFQKNILNFVKKYQLLFTTISLLLAIFITWEGRSLYLQTQNYLSFYSQWRPSIFIYTLVLSSLLFFLFNQSKLNAILIKKIASYSFFVYFIHVIFIEIFWSILPHTLLSHTLILFLIVLIPSYLLAFLVSKIKFLSRLTG